MKNLLLIICACFTFLDPLSFSLTFKECVICNFFSRNCSLSHRLLYIKAFHAFSAPEVQVLFADPS